MRPFLLGTLVLLASSLSAAVPLAPVVPVYGEQNNDDIAPAAASNGTHTLVAWTNAFSAYSQAWSICTRIVGVQSEGDCDNAGFRAVVASDGKDFLVVRSIGTSRFNSYPYDNIAANVIADDGTRGPTRILNNSVSAAAWAAAWNGREWMVAIIAEGIGRIVFLDHSLAETRAPLMLGDASDARFFERDGAWWCVQTRSGRTDVFVIDGTTRYSIDGAAKIAGSIAFIENGDQRGIATFDPQHGFGDVHPALANTRVIDAQAFGNGARAIVQSSRTDVNAVLVDASANITQTAALFTQEGYAYASMLGDTVYFSTRRVTTLNTERDVYAAPMQIAPLDVASATLVSAADRIVQHAPVIATSGDRGVALWMQSEPDGTTATYRRNLDANGHPTGDVHKLPYFVNTTEADLVLRGEQLVVVWSDGSKVHAGVDDETFVLGTGLRPRVATSADGTFAIWLAPDGLVHGTPLDARVPDGFALLPSFAPQSAAAITAIEGGFLVLWSTSELQSVVISPAGAVRSLTALGEPAVPFVAGKLAVWPRTLFAYAPRGVPFELFDPHWGRDWYPLAIEQLDADHYRVFLRRNEHVYTSDVSMESAWVTGITPLDYLGDFTDINRHNFASIGRKPLAVVRNGNRVEVVLPGSGKQRATRR